MRAFLESTIRRKLMGIFMLTIGVALVVACRALGAYDAVSYRHQMGRDLATSAEMVGQDGASALASGDRARRPPSPLPASRQARHHRRGRVLAGGQDVGHVRPRHGLHSTPLKALRGAKEISSLHRLAVVPPHQRNGALAGVIYVESDLSEWDRRLWRNALVALLALLASAGVALLLSLRLQHVISDPIAGLVQALQSGNRGKEPFPFCAPARQETN